VRLLFQWDSQHTCGHHGGVVARQVAGQALQGTYIHTVHDQLSRVAAGRGQGGSVGTEPIRPTTAAPGTSVFVRAAL